MREIKLRLKIFSVASLTIFAGIIMFGLPAFAFGKGEETAELTRSLAFKIMFSSVPDFSRIEEFIKICRSYVNPFRLIMKDNATARGVMIIFQYQAKFEKFRTILMSPQKEQIFFSSIISYRREIADWPYNEFKKAVLDRLKFVSRHKVYGKYGTAFEYSMNSEWFQQNGWIMEREKLTAPANRIKGFAGYLDLLSYFTLIVRLSDTQVMRIVATWNDAGGTLPLIGKISAKHEDIFDGIEKGHKDILEFLLR